MKTVTAALVGAGQRGMDSYAPYALRNPNEVIFTAVADTDPVKRKKFQELYNIKDEFVFTDWQSLLQKPRLADAVLICTQDSLHYAPSIASLQKGYNVLLEKPMAITPKECLSLGKEAKKYDKVFLLCHVMRYMPVIKAAKELIENGRIGDVVCIQHIENVGYWHQAHSFVRGNWSNSKTSSPMILAKACHDMDFMLWVADSECRTISSFGGLAHFKSINAPEGAPERCLDGCPAQEHCPYYAPRLYLTEKTDWPTSVISSDMSFSGRLKALLEGPYGRCVYRCGNDVVDHQIVNIEFKNDIVASFTMCAFTFSGGRHTKVMGTKGEIIIDEKEIIVYDFSTQARETVTFKEPSSGHRGGDEGIMREFISLIRDGSKTQGLTSVQASVHSHLMAFAAEKSRLKKRCIDMDEFEKGLDI